MGKKAHSPLPWLHFYTECDVEGFPPRTTSKKPHRHDVEGFPLTPRRPAMCVVACWWLPVGDNLGSWRRGLVYGLGRVQVTI